MTIQQIGKHTIEVYDAIEELPMKRFHRFNKMMLVDSGVGSDLTDIDKHLAKIKAFIATKEADNAVKEIDNLRTNLFLVMNNISPKMLAFSALIKTLDGEPCEDLSDEGLQRIVDKLNDTPIKAVEDALEASKKKIEDELISYFPKFFDTSVVKEYHDLLKKRTIAVLDMIIDSDNKEQMQAHLDNLTNEILAYAKPQIFGGRESIEIAFDQQFDRMTHLISSQLNASPKDYTVTEFYSAFDFIQEMTRQKLSSMRKNKVK